MIFDDFLRGRRRDWLEAEDLAMLEASASEIRELPSNHTLVRAGERVQNSTYLIDGLIARYMDDKKGLRQLVAVHVAGDFVDLHGYPLEHLDHNVATLTPARGAVVPHERIDEIVAQRPALAKLLWFSTLLDAAMHREWIFRLGRLDAVSRVGHFLCEMEAKLHAVGRSDGTQFHLAMTQADLAEACGITAIHINRTLRELRDRGLVQVERGAVTIFDKAQLMRLSDFDPAYLFIGNADRNS
jgi:CRP-like cAMP-binding protein